MVQYKEYYYSLLYRDLIFALNVHLTQTIIMLLLVKHNFYAITYMLCLISSTTYLAAWRVI